MTKYNRIGVQMEEELGRNCMRERGITLGTSWPKIPVSALSRGLSYWMTFIICLVLLILILLLHSLLLLLFFLFLFSVVRGGIQGIEGGKGGCRQAK